MHECGWHIQKTLAADNRTRAIPEQLANRHFLSAYIYDEFVSLLELTKNTRELDRLQESELLVLIERAVDNALINNNINLFTQNTVQYVWGNIWLMQQIIYY